MASGHNGDGASSGETREGRRTDSDYDLYHRKLQFTLKFQQLTGPVMAKGLEDTASYVYNRFLSVNEVGGSPKLFGHNVQEFHRGNLIRAEHWPFSMLATSTHDTKRSEDVRARLDVLSEMPRQWSREVMRWRRVNRSKKRVLADGRTVPDPNEEYLLYQTLVGAWPMDMTMSAADDRQQFMQRIQQYMEKALHEAKVNLSWINPDPDYVAAVNEFIARILTPGTRSKTNFFLESVQEFLPTVQYFGAINSLAQTLLKITSPGVPDVYQGTELWDFSLVDPDNRRPVNFAERREILRDLEAQSSSGDVLSLCTDLLDNYSNGRIKLWTTMRALQFRRDNPELFRASPYLPVDAVGEKQEHVISFAREASSAPASADQTMVIVAVPRFAYTLMKGRIAPPVGESWGDTELLIPPHAPNYFEKILTGEMVKVTNKRTLLCREVFANFPVALLSAR